jgi:hypothetical protein
LTDAARHPFTVLVTTVVRKSKRELSTFAEHKRHGFGAAVVVVVVTPATVVVVAPATVVVVAAVVAEHVNPDTIMLLNVHTPPVQVSGIAKKMFGCTADIDGLPTSTIVYVNCGRQLSRMLGQLVAGLMPVVNSTLPDNANAPDVQLTLEGHTTGVVVVVTAAVVVVVPITGAQSTLFTGVPAASTAPLFAVPALTVRNTPVPSQYTENPMPA